MRTNIIKISGIIILGIILFILNMFIGSVIIPTDEFVEILLNPSDKINPIYTIVYNYRLPQSVTALLAGAALAIAGLLMQTLFRNPLADPSMLGISSGAGLGVAMVVLVSGLVTGSAMSTTIWFPTIGISLSAFLGAIAVLFVIMSFANRVRNMSTLIIIGLMIAYLTGSITDILKYFSNKEDIHAFVIWGLGSFSAVGSSKLLTFSIIVTTGIIMAFILSKNLNIMLLGDSYAENLGLNIKRNNIMVILISGYLTAVVTAFCGPIAFIGLAVPHIARFLFRSSDHRILIPATALIGMDLALFCNIIARLPGLEGNLPVNAVTALIGAPVVIWVIFGKTSKHEEQ